MTAKWQAAIREVMAFSAVSETSAEDYANMENNASELSFNYRWEHVTTVVTLALKLAELVGADRDIVEAAAWLHDINKRDGQSHAKSGAAFARTFLSETDFPPEKIERVAQAIADHTGLRREKPLTQLESMVLWDADKLTKIGLTAAFHQTGMSLAGAQLTTMEDLIAGSGNGRWRDKTVASMHTGPARQAARARIEAFNRLWSELEVELQGGDLSND